jgi:hypothetical protein
MVCPFRLPENDGAVFAGIGFDILVALAGFGNRIGLGMATICSVFYWNEKVQAAFGLSGSLLASQKLGFLRKLRFL